MTAPRLRLAVNNCFAAKHWPSDGAWLALVWQWGLAAVQFSFDLVDPLQPAAVAIAPSAGEACRDAGIEVLSTFTGGRAYLTNMLLHPSAAHRAWARSWLESAVDLTAAIGSPATGGYLGAFPAGLGQAEREHFGKELVRHGAELGHHAARAGLEYLLVELMPGPGEVPGSPLEARKLLAALNAASPLPYYLCYDLGHACGAAAVCDGVGPANLYRWLEELLDVTRCVHLQQTDGRSDHHWPFSAAYSGVGVVEPDRVLEIVARSPLAEVDLVLELVHPPEAPATVVAEDWAQSVAVWRTALARRGQSA